MNNIPKNINNIQEQDFIDVSRCQHNFIFSHNETGDNYSTYQQKYAITICKNCGECRKGQIFFQYE